MDGPILLKSLGLISLHLRKFGVRIGGAAKAAQWVLERQLDG